MRRTDIDVMREHYASACKVNTMNAVVAVDKRDRSFILERERLVFRDGLFPLFSSRHRIVIDS